MQTPTPHALIPLGRRQSRPAIRRYRRTAAALVLIGALSGCTPSIELRGYVPDEATLSEIRSGVDNKRSVSDMLGTPSSVASFDNDIWYYISTTQKRVAFYDPELISRTIVAIEFDDASNVADIRRYAMADGRVVAYVERETPSLGRELTFLEQMFGNFGRFTGTQGRDVPGDRN